METTTFESRPAIQRYLSALEARLRPIPSPSADDGPADAALADAREYLLSEWESLRDAGTEPADDDALYSHLVARFGSPDDVAAAYGAPGATSVFPSQSVARADASPKLGRRPREPLALVLACAALLATCSLAAWLFTRSSSADVPTTVPPVEAAAPGRQPPIGELRTSWAERVVSFRFGTDQPRGAESAAPALGPSDGKSPQAGETTTCLSLGDGGELVVEFVSHTIVDGPGADLAIHEFGYFEPVRVAVSENGRDFIELGVTDHRLATFDLAKAGVSRARFVRVIDAQMGRTNDSSSPGAEIDSIAALNSVPVAPPK